MLRQATALALLLLLGLFLPAAATPLCLCLSSSPFSEQSCCGAADSCCKGGDQDKAPCCGDPQCCVIINGMPDGVEAQSTQLPGPLVAPLPVLIAEPFVIEPLGDSQPLPDEFRTTHFPGDPVRIAFGVWRL